MSGEKYIGLDVHQATISVAVMDSHGKLIIESILETKASTILEFLAGLRGTLSLTFEEGTWAAWLRFAQAACGPLDRVQSAQERSAQTWQQQKLVPCGLHENCSPLSIRVRTICGWFWRWILATANPRESRFRSAKTDRTRRNTDWRNQA